MQQIYRITLLGRKITAAHLQETQAVLQAAGLHIVRVREAVSRSGVHFPGGETDPGQRQNFSSRALSLEKTEIVVQGERPDRHFLLQRFLSMAAAGDIGIAVGKMTEEAGAEREDQVDTKNNAVAGGNENKRKRLAAAGDAGGPARKSVEVTDVGREYTERPGETANSSEDNKNGTNGIKNSGIRLICFDMDSTLIRGELMDELGKYLGIGEQMQRLTALTMRGELDFNESFTRRVALLEGLEVPVLEKIMKDMPAAPGLERAMAALQKAGCKTAIVTGGFTVFGRYLQKKYGFDEVYTTDIEVSAGKLTGRFGGPIIDGSRKAAALEALCRRENISVEQCAAVGDGANDIPMLTRAGLAIAYHSSGPNLYDLLEALECF